MDGRHVSAASERFTAFDFDCEFFCLFVYEAVNERAGLRGGRVPPGPIERHQGGRQLLRLVYALYRRIPWLYRRP